MSFPLLTATAALPAIGAIATAAVPGRPAHRRQVAGAALLAGHARAGGRSSLVRFDPGGARYQLTESHAWIRDFGVRYELGRGRHRGGAHRADRAADPVRHPGRLARRRPPGGRSPRRWRPTQGFFALILTGRGDGGPLLRGHRRLPLLHLLRSHAHPDVLPHRRLRGPGPRAAARRRRRGQRSYAAVKFLLYNLVGGLIMLAAVIGLYAVTPTSSARHLLAPGDRRGPRRRLARTWRPAPSGWLFLGFFFAFAVKAPLWPLHTWLPNAMGESTAAGRRADHRGRRQGRHLRDAPLLPPALPGGQQVGDAGDPGAGADQHRLRRAARGRPAGHQAADRLRVDLALRLHHPGHLRDDQPGPVAARRSTWSTTASRPPR